jgi:hypothetical protein
MTIPSEEAFAVALEDACEDYFGLYELVWDLNGKYAEASEAERLAAAQLAVTRLVREELATMFRTQWMSDGYEELDSKTALQLLADPASWRPPADSPDASYYCFASTPAGEALYFQQASSDPKAG